MDKFNVIVEIPEGGGHKYNLQLGKMMLKKVMPVGIVFPFELMKCFGQDNIIIRCSEIRLI